MGGAGSRVSSGPSPSSERPGIPAGVRDALVIAFLLTIVSVPLIDGSNRLRADPSTGWFDTTGTLRSWRQIVATRRDVMTWIRLTNPWRLRESEDTLTHRSSVGTLVRPWIQWFLTRWLGTGSEEVSVGRDGWLFYRTTVKYVTGPGFLDPEQLSRRSADSADGGVQPDPRKAIVQFRDILKTIGVSLVVLPIPEKATIRPRSFSPLGRPDTLRTQNASWETFSADLRQNGIRLLDLGPLMYKEENEGNEQFLRNDTHWSPSGVDIAARALAAYLNEAGVPAGPPTRYSRQPIDFVRGGDLVELLNLPPSRRDALFPPHLLTAQQVLTSSGSRWQRDPSSDILLIGDSFLEIYSHDEPDSDVPPAGLAEQQLSYYLQRPIDRIASHRWGPFGAREALGDTIQRVRLRARGRKIIVWEFASRYLAVGNWKLMD